MLAGASFCPDLKGPQDLALTAIPPALWRGCVQGTRCWGKGWLWSWWVPVLVKEGT